MADKNSGIIDPPIDDLLSKVDSKYQLVIFASKRARQINDYYADLHEGSLFDNVGPLVDSTIDDKPLSVALHEINEDKLDPEAARRARRSVSSRSVVEPVETRAMNVVVGITGGIAAYKAVAVVRALVLAGHDVHVVATDAALRFVGRPTLEAISRNPVHSDLYEGVAEVRHVAIGQRADLIVIAPATAHTLAKLATGLADDLLGNTVLASKAPLVLAPAMHTEMWQHPATVANVATARRARRPHRGPGERAAHRLRLGPGAHGGARRDRRRRARGRRPARSGRPPHPDHGGRHARAARPGALHRQPVERQAGRRARPRGRGPRRRRSRSSSRTSTTASSRRTCAGSWTGFDVIHVSTTARAAGGDAARRRHRRTR